MSTSVTIINETNVRINGTVLSLKSIIRTASPKDMGIGGEFYPRMFILPEEYAQKVSELLDEKQFEPPCNCGDVVSFTEGGYKWMYQIDSHGGYQSCYFTVA